MELTNILDLVQEEVVKNNPHMSELEAAFVAIRANLHALTGSLIEFGMTGQDLPNDGLKGICSGLMMTIEWMLAKEEAFEDVGRIEDALNNGDWNDSLED